MNKFDDSTKILWSFCSHEKQISSRTAYHVTEYRFLDEIRPIRAPQCRAAADARLEWKIQAASWSLSSSALQWALSCGGLQNLEEESTWLKATV